jgi:hypothetical protein
MRNSSVVSNITDNSANTATIKLKTFSSGQFSILRTSLLSSGIVFMVVCAISYYMSGVLYDALFSNFENGSGMVTGVLIGAVVILGVIGLVSAFIH